MEKGKKPIKVEKNTNGKKPIVINKKKTISQKKIKTLLVIFISVIVLFFVLYNVCKPSVEKIKDSVVKIEVYDDSNNLLATGSGFCAYRSDLIVTNFHVIEGASSLKIITDDNESYDVLDVLIFDSENDLALLKTEVNLSPLSFGSVRNLKAGQKVTAIGSPLGELNTVSTGIISNAENKRGIQISASISHGSSGGALFNKNNRLIGITYATLSNGQNLNYAISLEYLENMFSAYKNNNYEEITDSNYESCMSNYDDNVTFDGCLGSNYDYYSTSSFDVLSLVTNIRNRFNYSMENNDWSNVYSNTSNSTKELAMDYYEALQEKYFCDETCNIIKDVDSWDLSEFMINLDIIDKYELAYVMADLKNINKNAVFNKVNEYPLEVGPKVLIAYYIGDQYWSNITSDNKKDLCDYIYELPISTEEMKAILQTIGYEVKNNNDGTITAYWR